MSGIEIIIALFVCILVSSGAGALIGIKLKDKKEFERKALQNAKDIEFKKSAIDNLNSVDSIHNDIERNKQANEELEKILGIK